MKRKRRTWSVVLRHRVTGRTECEDVRATTPLWAARRALHQKPEGAWSAVDVSLIDQADAKSEEPHEVLVRFLAPGPREAAERAVATALLEADDGDSSGLQRLSWAVESSQGKARAC